MFSSLFWFIGSICNVLGCKVLILFLLEEKVQLKNSSLFKKTEKCKERNLPFCNNEVVFIVTRQFYR